MVQYVAYLRTSSTAKSKDMSGSKSRQMKAIKNYIEANKGVLRRSFYDIGISGTKDVLERAQFVSMLDYCKKHKITNILIENSSRLARDTLTALLAHKFLKDSKIDIIAVDNPEMFISNTPTNELIRNILISISTFEKQTIVYRLKAGKQRILNEGKKCGGRKSYKELNPELVKEVKALNITCLSLREISKKLAEKGITNSRNKPIHPQQINRILSQT